MQQINTKNEAYLVLDMILLFLLYINDLNKAVAHSKVYHFPDDTNFYMKVQFLYESQ